MYKLLVGFKVISDENSNSNTQKSRPFQNLLIGCLAVFLQNIRYSKIKRLFITDGIVFKGMAIGEQQAELEGGIKCVISLESLCCHKRSKSSPPGIPFHYLAPI